MRDEIRRERVGRVDVLHLRGAGATGLSAPGLLAGGGSIAEALSAAAEDPTVAAVAILAAGRHFHSPAALKTSDTELAALCTAMENFPKPVVLGLSGPIVDNGLALALAGHYRLATRDTQADLPCLAAGLLPAPGTIQRLTRLSGAALALDLLLGDQPLSASEMAAAGLVDGIVKGDLESSVIALARRLAASGAGARATRSRTEGRRDLAGATRALAAARDWSRGSDLQSHKAAVDAVAAAIARPWKEGLAIETALAAALRTSQQAAALAHLADARARALAAARGTGEPPLAVERIAVVTGPEASAQDYWVLDLLRAGFEVTLLAPGAEQLAQAHRCLKAGAARSDLELLSKLKGAQRIDPEVQPDLALLMPSAHPPALRCPFAELQDTVAGAPVHGAFALCPTPLDIPGALVEILPGTGAGGRATANALVRRLGRFPLTALDDTGAPLRLVGPLFTALLRAMEALVEDGAMPGQVDKALMKAGYAQGVFAMADRRGLDRDARMRTLASGVRDPRARYLMLGDRLCAAGRTGRSRGAGYHRYDPSGCRVPHDPDLAEIIAQVRSTAGITPRAVTAREIVERADLALALASMRLLDATASLRPDQVDLAAVAGLGFPRWRGGPLHAAAALGPARLEERRRSFEADDPEAWSCPQGREWLGPDETLRTG